MSRIRNTAFLTRLKQWMVEYVTAAVEATNGTPATNTSTEIPPTPYIPATYALEAVAISTGFIR
jgi:hypothetical protein